MNIIPNCCKGRYECILQDFQEFHEPLNASQCSHSRLMKKKCKTSSDNTSNFEILNNIECCFQLHIVFFYKKHTSWLQPRCFLSFCRVEPQMFLKCFLNLRIL